MKKLVMTLTLICAMVWALPSQANIKFGAVGGLNLSNLSFSGQAGDDIMSKDNHAGWFLGVKTVFTVPIIGIGLDASLLYSQSQISADDEDVDAKTLRSFEIPINARYSIGLSSLFAVYVATGPQFGFNLGNKTWSSLDNAYDTVEGFRLKNSTVTWNFGAGVVLLKHLEVGANYNMCVNKLAETFYSNSRDFGTKKSTWQIHAAYYF